MTPRSKRPAPHSKLPAPAPGSRLIESKIGDPLAADTPVRQTLPEDLLQEAAHRLRVVCLLMACLVAATFLLVHFVFRLPGMLNADELGMIARWIPVYDVVGSVVLLVSLGLYWYARKSRRGPRFLLDLALAYEVLTALSIGLLNYAVSAPKERVSWIAVLILIFPAIIPTPPRKTLIAALLAASMDPLAALIARAAGVQESRAWPEHCCWPSLTTFAPAWRW